jgi:hypothetical protein
VLEDTSDYNKTIAHHKNCFWNIAILGFSDIELHSSLFIFNFHSRLNIRNNSSDGLPTFTVVEGSRFMMKDCHVTCPGHGVVGVAGASVTIEGCDFSQVLEALVVSDGGSINISNSRWML